MARVVRFHSTGSSQVLRIEDLEIAAPQAGEVQIEVKALGINRAEVMYRSGQYTFAPTFPAILGYEASGVIRALGAGVSGLQVGDAVSVIPAFSFTEYGMYGEVVNAPAHSVVHLPENLTFEEGAATWMMFMTAYGALVEFGSLQAGEVVLISAASSSVGLAAIQIANLLGAIPVALTRTSEKRQALLAAGAAHVIATTEQDVQTEVMAITNGLGARMAFDPVGGPEVSKLLGALSLQGIFFQYGALDSRDLSVRVMDILGKHLTLRGYELFEITQAPMRLEKAKRFILRGLASGQLRPVIGHVFAFDDIALAHDFMESNNQIGKIVVQL
jgi:NADPH:quinone reductase-like Zn-dependent oxidoreductase